MDGKTTGGEVLNSFWSVESEDESKGSMHGSLVALDLVEVIWTCFVLDVFGNNSSESDELAKGLSEACFLVSR